VTNVPNAYIGTSDGSGNSDLRLATRVGGVLTDQSYIAGTSGNVGIGTTTPGSPLDIKNAIKFQTDTTELNNNSARIFFSEDSPAIGDVDGMSLFCTENPRQPFSGRTRWGPAGEHLLHAEP
jgi:hypothetical protein